MSFGAHAQADARLIKSSLHPRCSTVQADILGTELAYKIGAPGRHLVHNSLAVLAVADLVGADLALAALALAEFKAISGRGAPIEIEPPGGTALLIDESYNANPASVDAALALLGQAPIGPQGRRIAVLGDMLELGPKGKSLHRGLAMPIAANAIDLVFCCGPLMQFLVAGPSRGPARRLCRGLRRARSASGARDPCRRRRHGQGVARFTHGAHRQGAATRVSALSKKRPHRVEAMFYWLVDLSDKLSVLNVFRYITFRTGGSVITALLFVFMFGQNIIDRLRLFQGKGQPIRADGPKSHIISKAGTPTMGGLMILSGMLVSTLLWANPANVYVWVVLLVTLGFGFVGFYDDYLKVKKQTHNGFSGRTRLGIETLIAAVACIVLVQLGHTPFSTSLVFPFFKELVINLSWAFVLFAMFIIVGAGNAVNLTDGLDGLAIVPVMIAAASFGMISYLSGNAVFADYLQIHYVAGTGELAVLCGAVVGAGLGFLWFNAPPASIFMGDTGSLALGGLIGTVAVATKHEIVLAVIGGLFVLEAVSVIVQVVSFKLFGRRVFKMAPIHHHFEQLGWTEPQIVIRFWIVSVVLALAGLSTLKLR